MRAGPRPGAGAVLAAVVSACLTLGACAGPAALRGPGAGASPAASPSPVALDGPPRYRALWVDAFHPGIKSRAEVDELIQRAHVANLNALFVQVRKRGDSYYARSLEPRAADPALARDFDPLAYLVKRAHSTSPRLEVHAWLNTFYTGKQAAVWKRHAGEWGNKKADGTDEDTGYLDPGAPEVRDYTKKVFLEVVRNYDVDGVHCDFVRYPDGGDWGYSPAGLAAWHASGVAGAASADPPAPNDPAFAQWRRDNVTAFVHSLHDAVKALKPRVKVSGALIAYGAGPASVADWEGTRTYADVYQDWRTWLTAGYLDLGLVMDYDRESSRQQAGWFRGWAEWDKNLPLAAGVQVLVGVGAFLNYPEDTLSQIGLALAPSAAGRTAAGVAIYSYASTSVYGTDDFYLHPDEVGYLPRQPYAPDTSAAALAARAANFNAAFWTQLSEPFFYMDPAVGRVETRPVFPTPVAVP